MGMHDRDYYKEWWNNREGQKKRAPFWKSKRDLNDLQYDPRVFRSRDRNDGGSGLPDVPGANWHWAIQALVWLAVVAALFLVFKVVENRQAQRRILVLQQQQIEKQKKQIEELQKALQPRPKVDFFK